MPELPDITVYIEALEQRIVGRRLNRARLLSPFLLRTVEPPITAAQGRTVNRLRRIGKRVVLGLEGSLFLIFHLMIAGRLRWLASGEKLPGRIALAAFEFDNGILVLTEAGTKRRAALHLVEGEAALAQFKLGGAEPLEIGLSEFSERLRSENHTLKRALTDPRIFSGIGNAYSDEILHCARLSPVALSAQLSDAEVERLYCATRNVLTGWIERLRAEAGDRFPEQVTAFREGMAVHGRFGQPCPVCGARIQRIVYANNETNYCARCQTGGKLLADRALSRLLHKSWPKSIDEIG